MSYIPRRVHVERINTSSPPAGLLLTFESARAFRVSRSVQTRSLVLYTNERRTPESEAKRRRKRSFNVGAKRKSAVSTTNGRSRNSGRVTDSVSTLTENGNLLPGTTTYLSFAVKVTTLSLAETIRVSRFNWVPVRATCVVVRRDSSYYVRTRVVLRSPLNSLASPTSEQPVRARGISI